MSSVKSYFEEHAHSHVYHNDPDVYKFIVTLINDKQVDNKAFKILDVGCGDGAFIKSLLRSNINADYVATDISYTMINLAKNNIDNSGTLLLVSDAFNIPINRDYRFDLIHIDSVLHHIIGKTRGESKQMANKLLESLLEKLTKNGKIIIEEVNYDSYLVDEITSILIFYGLKILNKLGLDIHKLMNEFHKGLEVRFYSEKEFVTLLRNHGDPVLMKKIPWKVTSLYKLFLLKRMGHITYFVTKI